MHGTLTRPPESAVSASLPAAPPAGAPETGAPETGADQTGAAQTGAAQTRPAQTGASPVSAELSDGRAGGSSAERSGGGSDRTSGAPPSAGASDAARPAGGWSDPFLNRPSPDSFFPAPPHRNAWTFLRRALPAAVPFVLLTGAFGAGKTMLTLRLVQAIRSREIGPCVHMSTPAQGPGSVLRRVAQAAGLDPDVEPDDPRTLAQRLKQHLTAEPPARRLFVVLEDPQDLDPDDLATLLATVPLVGSGHAPLTMVLIGHTTLPRLLQGARFRSFDARIRKRHHLDDLDAQQTRAYIDFRLTTAAVGEGGGDVAAQLPGFDDGALRRIYELTRGNPREINNICGTSLNQARALGIPRIDRATVDQAARALGRDIATPHQPRSVVVRFPGDHTRRTSVRGCPDYVRTVAQPARESLGADGQTAADATLAATTPSVTIGEAAPKRLRGAGRRRPHPLVRIGMAAIAALLAAGYLAAPYLERAVAPTTRTAAPEALSQAERQEVEALLQRLDFETGPVDGVLDPTTRASVQSYKEMSGLRPADRTVGPDLLRDLRAVAGNLTPPPAEGAR